MLKCLSQPHLQPKKKQMVKKPNKGLSPANYYHIWKLQLC